MTQNLPARQGDVEPIDTGLEDFDPNTAAIPRISINHPDGTFKDNLSGEEFAGIYGIILGLVKQRVMFSSTMGETTLKPQCKSSDAAVGYPNMQGSADELFPWNTSGLNISDLPKDDYGRVTIPCEACPFSQWGPNRKPPLCSERHTFPIMYSRDPAGISELHLPYAGIAAFQRSGITPSRNYLSAFSRAKIPLYSAFTEITLKRESRGTVRYSVPVFRKMSDVPPERWEELAREYRNLREFLRRPPRPGEDSDNAKQHTSSGSVAAPTEQQFVQPQSVLPQQPVIINSTVAAPASTGDDELPF